VDPTADGGTRAAPSLGQLWGSLLEGLVLRLDLFALEVKEEKERLFVFLLLGGAFALSAFMAFLVLNLAILVVAGEHRGVVLVAMVAFYALLACGLALGLWRRVRAAPAPFAATIEEIKKDQALFSGQ